MRSSQVQYDQSKVPRRRILGSVNRNSQAVIRPTKTKPSSVPPFFASVDDLHKDSIRRPSNSDRSYAKQKKPRIPATDPKKTAVLWQKVMAQKFVQPTQASKAKAKAKAKSPSGSRQSRKTGIAETTYPTSGRTTSSSGRPSGITIDNSNFRELILHPRNISIDNSPLSRPAFQHFCTLPPSRYQDIDGLESTTVFLEGDDRFKINIVDQYKEMKEWGLCEAEYAQYALEHLIKSETRDPDATPTRAWKTKRMVQLVAKPEDLWKSPPILDKLQSSTKDYNFDVRPDCAYWIPIEVFNKQYIHLVKELTFAKYGKIVCPYLSIEFKKDDAKEEKAENQIAVAASIALYNRFKLKERRLQEKKKNWTENHLFSIKHYGITFRASKFTIWCIRPTKPLDIEESVKETWTGCQMESVHKNECESLIGVENLMDWVNEIHRWGLKVHGDSCQRDVQHCIEADDIVRTSLGATHKLPDSDTDPEPSI